MSAERKEETVSQYFYSIDLAKFICAVLVVTIHIVPFEGIGFLSYGIKNYIARLSVPFFFMMSGFLLFRKTACENFNTEYILNYVLKILRLYLIWSIIYFYPRVKDIIKSGGGLFRGTLVYIKHFLFVGSYLHLWYLNALIVAVVLITILIRRKYTIRSIIAAAGFFYFCGLLAQSWFGLIVPLRELQPGVWAVLKLLQKLFHTTRNGLCEGFLFVGLGMVFAFKDVRIDRKKCFLGFAISMSALLIEGLFVRYYDLARGDDMYIFLVPAVFFLFHIVLHTELKERKIYRTLRALGGLIYYTHMWPSYIIYNSLDISRTDTVSKTTIFMIVVLSSLAVSYIILRLSEMKYFRWLRYLYS